MRVEEAEPPDVRLTDEGLRDTRGPDGETVALKVRVPEKPFVLVNVMEVVPDEPGAVVRDAGPEVIEKSSSLIGKSGLGRKACAWPNPAAPFTRWSRE